MEETTAEHIAILLVVMPIAAITLYLAVRLRYFHIPEQNLPLLKNVPARYCLGAFSVFLGTQVLFIPLLALTWKNLLSLPYPTGSEGSAWFLLFSILSIAAALAGYLRCLPLEVRQSVWGAASLEGKSATLQAIGIGLLSWLVSYPLMVCLSQLIASLTLLVHEGPAVDQVAVIQLKTAMDFPLPFLLLSLSVVFIVPWIEETLFRGFLQNSMRSRLSRKQAIFYSSVIFALFHFSFSQGVKNIEILFSLLLLSLFLGFNYERQRSLFAPIALHSGFNAFSVIMLMLES